MRSSRLEAGPHYAIPDQFLPLPRNQDRQH